MTTTHSMAFCPVDEGTLEPIYDAQTLLFGSEILSTPRDRKKTLQAQDAAEWEAELSSFAMANSAESRIQIIRRLYPRFIANSEEGLEWSKRFQKVLFMEQPQLSFARYTNCVMDHLYALQELLVSDMNNKAPIVLPLWAPKWNGLALLEDQRSRLESKYVFSPQSAPVTYVPAEIRFARERTLNSKEREIFYIVTSQAAMGEAAHSDKGEFRDLPVENYELENGVKVRLEKVQLNGEVIQTLSFVWPLDEDLPKEVSATAKVQVDYVFPTRGIRVPLKPKEQDSEILVQR